MSKGKKLTFLVTILCAFALLMSVFGISPLAVTAAEDIGNKITATTNATVKQGNTGYCYVYIDSLESLSSLNVAVHYDPDKISVTSSFNQVNCSLYDSSVGESYVQYSYIFDGNGEDAKTQLFYFQYTVLSNAEVGGAYFDIVVSEAYDSSLNVADVTGSRCGFIIAETVTAKSCSISGTSSVTSSIKEEFELSYRLNTTGVASGSFVIRYDAELFEFVELTQGGLLDNKIVDVKTDLIGTIYVSFVGTEYASSSQLLNVKFKTIKNVTETSQIKLSVTDFYDLELNNISCNGYTTTAKVTYDSLYSENAPIMAVTPVYSAENNKVTLTIKLDKNAHLGAGDFALKFDTDFFTYNSCEKGFLPDFFNVNDKNVSEGVLKFSIVSLSDIISEETVLTVVFDTPVFCEDVATEFDLSGSGLADSMTNAILLNFVDASLSISGVGHDKIAHKAQVPTCTEIGWHAYDTCSRCDYTTYEEIPANGHSYVHTLCSVCGSKQPVYKSWDVSAAGDGSLAANLYQNVVDGGYELEISGTGEMADWTSTSNVPWYNGYRTQINYLVIENGVTSVGARAFTNMTGIAAVSIPNSVEEIGDYAFSGCTGVSSLTLGSSVKTIGNYAFNGCTALTTISIPNSAETIGSYAFYSCSGVAELSMGTSTTTIGTYAFGNCSALTSITIPESVTTIGNYAFYNCKAIGEIRFNAAAMNDLANNNYVFYNVGVDGNGVAVTVGQKVTKIPAYLFYSNSNNTSYLPKIKNVIFEDNSVCESIGAYAFASNKTITQIVLPESVKSIGKYAFYNCSNLHRVMIPSSVTSIDSNAFYYCPNAVFAFVGDSLPATLGSNWKNSEATYYLNVDRLVIVDDALYVIFNDNTATLAKYYGVATEYQVRETIEGVFVTAIGSNAFRNNTTIECVTIPDAVIQVDTYAFYGCSALKSITIPKNVATIGKYAFYNCTNIEEIIFNAIAMGDLAYENFVFYNNGINTDGIAVTIGAEVTKIPAYLFRPAHDSAYPKVTSIVFAENSVCQSIGHCSFYRLDHLTTIIIPKTVISIDSHAMSYCAKLTIGFEAAELPATLGSYWNSDSGYYLNVKEFVIFDDATYVITNDNVAILGRYFGTAEQYQICEEVKGIAVTQVGDYAFYRNKTLVEVTMPNSITSIGNYAFYYCTSLESVILSSNLNSIGNNAFYGCSALTSVLIPETVTNIGSGAFNSCTKLTIGFVSGTQDATLGSSWSGDTGYYFNVKGFVLFDNATYVVTKDNSAILGKYYGTEAQYAILENVNGASVTIIGKNAFRNATALVNVSIPNTVTRIENYAFYYCTSLESITFPQNIAYIGNYAFYYTRALTEINFNAIASNELNTGNYVFYCSGQAGDGIKVTIGAQVTKIPNCLFYPNSDTSCLPKITEFVFEEGSVCKIIGSYTFAYNTNLSNVILPEGVEVIGSYAFANTNISSIVIPNSVTTINNYAFSNCTNLATVQMPSTLTTIGSYAFYNCSSLKEIVIPENVTSIGSAVFQNSGLKLVYICSDKIAYNANSATACGYLLNGVSTVIIRSDIEIVSAYITENYTNTEAITYQGVDYTSYGIKAHSWAEYEVLVPFIACEQDGCIRYICSDCGAFKDVTTFRHDVVVNAAKEPTCLDVGWHEYHTCSRCDYTTYAEIPALGHRVLVDGRIWVDSITFENDANYPFLLKDGIYSSTNKTDNSDSFFTITALYDCTLNISYAVSSEQNYDKIIIRRNGVIVVEISGQVDWSSQTIELTAGDIITINYHKDGSQAHHEDTGWFSITCEQTQIGALVSGPAADAEPTCTDAVVCHYCQTVVKEALGHDAINQSAKAPTCTEIGWHAYVTCSRCDHSTYVEIPANGHSYGEWAEILAPTCTVVGTERRDCDDCDHYETRDVAVLGHDEISHDAKDSTCVEIGWHAYVTCSRCDYTTYEEIAALGHNEISHPAKDPTCTEIGWHAYVTCSRCDYTTYVERAVLGHDTINHEAQAPTCTEIGWYAYDTCSRCEYTTYEEIAATGHRYTNKICVNCGEGQPPSYSWDISENSDGSVMAYCYALNDGNYLMEIVGSGAMKDWENSATPWSNVRGKITQLTIGDQITKIGSYAFAYMSELVLVEIPDNITTIGYHAFADCKKLTVVLEHTSLPEGFDKEWCYYIGYYLNPKEVYVTNDSTFVVTRDDSVILTKYNGVNMSFEIPSTVSRVGDYAFSNNNAIEIVYVPTSIIEIGKNGLANNSYGLIAIFDAATLPNSLGQSWNSGCAYYLNPKNVIVNDDSIYIVAQNNEVCFARYLGEASTFAVANTVGGYAVTHIGDYAFANCYNLVDLTLPDSIYSIGQRAFYNCTNLKDFDMPNNLKTIGEWAFWYCQSFENLVLPEGLESMGGVTFGHCIRLESVKIPSTLKVIPNQAFTGCYNIRNVEIAEGVTRIMFYAFRDSTLLESIVIPKSMTTIEGDAFGVLPNLKLVIIKSSTIASGIHNVTSLGGLCNSAVTVVIPYNTVPTTFLMETYPVFENALIDGEYYVIYSLSQHNWVDSTIIEMEECVIDGLIHHTCSDCGVRKDTVIPCHDIVHHNAKTPSCTDIGWNAYETCSRCDYSTCVEIPANGHSYGEWVETNAPTCTTVGTERRDCDNCDHYEIRDVAAIGHNLTHHSAKAVTCTNIGWDAFDTCSRCDYTTYEEIPATGHTYGDWEETKTPTCLIDGSERRDCNDCDHFETRDVAALGHDITHHNAQAVTCTVIGWGAYDACSRCDYTTYEEIPATGHTASDWIIDAEATYEADGSKHKECTVCHEVLETSTIPMLTHSYVAVVTPPTCTEQGYTTHTCSDCGNSYIDDYVPAIGHSYGAWVQTLDPKCELAGTERRDCDVCDYYETRDVSATGHTKGEWIVDSNATCTVNGSKHIECTVCEKILETYVLPKLGHDEVIHTAKTPTCTEIGWSMYVTCTRCDYTTYEEIPANGHDYGEWITEIPAGCESEGTLGHYHCDDCNTTFDINYNVLNSLVIPESGHKESEWIVDIETTCMVDGIKHKECTVCEKILTTEVISMLGHDTIHHSAKTPTCTEIGWNAYELCTRCSYTTYIEKPANGHNYGDWIAEASATCEGEGTLGHYHCSACGCNFDINKNSLDYLVIAATGHTEGEWIVDSNATCTVNGSRHIECSVCRKTLKAETITKLGHAELVHAAKTPTCTEIGWNSYVTCSRCAYSTYKEIAASGHAYGEWTETESPTCLTKGSERRDCNDCNLFETRDIAALGHNEIPHSAQMTTCTEIGWDAYVTCTRCDYSTYVEIEALGHDETSHEAQEPTCTEDGWKAYVECSRCDYTTYAKVPATGHDYGKWIETKAPTCINIGTEQRDCANCDHYETRDVEVLGHDEITHLAQAPTCTEVGWDTYITCSRCDVSTFVEIPAKGHSFALNGNHTCVTCRYSKTPGQPVMESKTHNSIILLKIEGFEYSVNGTIWQSSNVFENLSADSTYTVYQRVKESTTALASEISPALVVKTDEEPVYTIVFQDGDGAILSTNTYHYGDMVIVPADPTKVGDNTYNYVFAGWDKEIVNCMGDAIYTATYTASYIDYTIEFKNWDGYILSTKTYHWDDEVTVPGTPSKDADNTYTYAFAGWDKPVVNCAGNATYTAVYTSTYIDYTVVFKNWSGTVLSTKTYHWGDKVTAPADPTKPADNTYTYVFAGWDKSVVNCAGNATYTATYAPTYIDYTVVFKDWDGTILSSKTYHWGDEVTTPTEPTKEADNTYVYTFVGWDMNVANCAGSTTYIAVYTSTYIDYTVVFKNWNGTVLSTKTYHWGDSVIAPTNPTRPYDEDYIYTFAGWDKSIVSCNGDAIYTATYNKTAIAITSIAVTTKPTKLTYVEGEPFNQSGMIVTAYYNNNTSKAISGYTISGYTSTVGIKTITVTYEGKTATFTVTVNSKVPSTVTSSAYTISGGNVSKIAVGTSVKSLLSGLNEGSFCKVYNGNTEVSGNTAVGTGMVVKIMDGNTTKASYTIIVTGDTNGDGKISVTDMLAVKAHVLKKNTLSGASAQAADTSGDKAISITDFIQMKAHILGKSNVEPRAVNSSAQQLSTASVEPEASVAAVTTEHTTSAADKTVSTLNYIQVVAVVPDKKSLVTL